MAIAATTIIGPNGDSIYRGSELPDEWPEEFRADLILGGAAVEIEDEDELQALLARWNRPEPEK